MRVILTFCLILFASSLKAETYQHGNIIYTLPEGWSLGGAEDGVQTLTSDQPDDRCQYCYVYIGKGAAKNGSLTDFVSAIAPSFVDEDDRDKIKVLQGPELTNIGAAQVAMLGMLVDGDPYFVIGYNLPSRFEVVAFQGDGGYEGDKMDTTMAVLSEQILPMLAGLTFVSEGALPLMPAPEPGPLQGVWLGTYVRQSLGIDMMVKLEVDFRYIVFWSDGYFYDGTPPDGQTPLDAKALTDRADERFGTYAVSGDKITLSYVTGRSETLSYPETGRLNDGDRDLYPAELLADGTVINGTIASFFYTGFTPGSGVEGGISGSSSTTFRPDGTYTGESYGGAFGNFVDGAGSMTGGFATKGGGTPSGGRYEVKGGLLIQYPNTGGPARAVFISKSGKDIVIGEQYLGPG